MGEHLAMHHCLLCPTPVWERGSVTALYHMPENVFTLSFTKQPNGLCDKRKMLTEGDLQWRFTQCAGLTHLCCLTPNLCGKPQRQAPKPAQV